MSRSASDLGLRAQSVTAAVTAGSVVTAILFQRPWSRAIYGDIQFYFATAERVASGVSPSVSSLDVKTSFAPLLAGAAIRAGRVVGVDDLWSYRILWALVLVATAIATALVAARLTGSVVTAVLAGTVWAGYYTVLQDAEAKSLVTLLIPVMLLALHERWVAVLGLAAAVAVLTWQPGIIVSITAVLGLALSRPTRREIATFVMTGMVVAIAYVGYFAATGTLDEHLSDAVIYPLRYYPPEDVSIVGGVVDLLRVWRGGYPWNWLPAIAAVAAAVGTVAWWRTPDATTRGRLLRRWAPFATCSLLFAAWTYSDHQGPRDFLPLLPTISILAAAGCGRLLARAAQSPVAIRSAVVAAVAVVTITPATVAAFEYRNSMALQHQRDQSAVIAACIESGAPVYVQGPVHLLALSRLGNLSKYSLFWRGSTEYLAALGHLASDEDQPTFVPRAGDALPVVIVRSRMLPPGWNTWLPEHYVRRPHAAFPEPVDVWVRRRPAADRRATAGCELIRR